MPVTTSIKKHTPSLMSQTTTLRAQKQPTSSGPQRRPAQIAESFTQNCLIICANCAHIRKRTPAPRSSSPPSSPANPHEGGDRHVLALDPPTVRGGLKNDSRSLFAPKFFRISTHPASRVRTKVLAAIGPPLRPHSAMRNRSRQANLVCRHRHVVNRDPRLMPIQRPKLFDRERPRAAIDVHEVAPAVVPA